MDWYQQGDVRLVPVERIPQRARKVIAGVRGNVLAEGEATGHAHTIDPTLSELFRDEDGTLYLRVSVPAPLVHEEHHPIMVPQQDYVVGRVKEYDHFKEEARVVRD